MQLRGWRVVRVLVHAHDHRVAALHAHLLLVGAASDLLLEERRRDGPGGTAQLIDARQQLHRARLELGREMLHVVAPRQRVGGGRHARFVRQNLLGAQRQCRRSFRG